MHLDPLSGVIAAREGWAHVGCPTCGHVTTVPLDHLEPPPWCVHNGTTTVWRDPHPETQRSGPKSWTRMVRVRVTVHVRVVTPETEPDGNS